MEKMVRVPTWGEEDIVRCREEWEAATPLERENFYFTVTYVTLSDLVTAGERVDVEVDTSTMDFDELRYIARKLGESCVEYGNYWPYLESVVEEA